MRIKSLISLIVFVITAYSSSVFNDVNLSKSYDNIETFEYIELDEEVANQSMELDAYTVTYNYENSLNPYEEPYVQNGAYSHLNYLDLGEAWNENRGEDVTIAYIDTPVRYDHHDLVDENGDTLISSRSYLIDQNNPNGIQCVAEYGYDVIKETRSTTPHSTSTIGVAAASLNDRFGVGLSMNSEIVLMALANHYVGELINALNILSTMDVDIINISMSIYKDSWTTAEGEVIAGAGEAAVNTLKEYIDLVIENGSIVVASAGNDATSELSYPAAFDNVISVGALADNSSTEVASYSNYGKVDIVAPGYCYTTKTDYSARVENMQLNGHAYVTGTSFSAPLVASAIALYKSRYPYATSDEIRSALLESAVQISAEKAGHGRLSVASFLGVGYGEYNYTPIIIGSTLGAIALISATLAVFILVRYYKQRKSDNIE